MASREESPIYTMDESSSSGEVSDPLDTEPDSKDLFMIAGHFDNVVPYTELLGLNAAEQADVRNQALLQGTQSAMFNCLSIWKRRATSYSATYQCLLDILDSLEKDEIADNIRQYVSSKYPSAQVQLYSRLTDIVTETSKRINQNRKRPQNLKDFSSAPKMMKCGDDPSPTVSYLQHMHSSTQTTCDKHSTSTSVLLPLCSVNSAGNNETSDQKIDTHSNVLMHSVISCSSLKEQVDKLEAAFKELASSVCKYFVSKSVTLGAFRSITTCMSMSLKTSLFDYLKTCFNNLDSDKPVANAWPNLSSLWDFLNYELLEHIIEMFIPDHDKLRVDIKSYAEVIKAFSSSTKVQKFFEVWLFRLKRPKEAKMKKMVLKMEKSWDECTLQDIRDCTNTLASVFSLPRPFLLLRDITEGCMSILWYVPSSVAASLETGLTEVNPETMSDNGFLSVSIDDIIVYSLLKAHVSALETACNQLATHTFNYLKQHNVTISDFEGMTASMGVALQHSTMDYLDDCFEKIDTNAPIARLWRKLSIMWDFLNYEFLKHIIDMIIPPNHSIHSRLKLYIKDVSRFSATTKVCEFFEQWPLNACKPEEANLKKLVIKAKGEWREVTIRDLKDASDTLVRNFSLPRPFLLLRSVKEGCVSILWYVPSFVAASLESRLTEVKANLMAETGFLSVSIDNIMVYPLRATRRLAIQLHSMYTAKFSLKVKAKALLSFKLAIIEKRVLLYGVPDEFTRATLRGDKDDIRYSKSPISLDRIGYLPNDSPARLVLVEGLPGSGKTTFSREFSLKWAFGVALKDSVLILLPLRDYNVRKVTNLQELLAFIKPGDGSLEEELETSKGEGLTFWLDGWDELVSSLDGRSIYEHLVAGEILPNARVIVSSRHWATSFIKKQLDKQPSQHIEIVSSFQDQIDWLAKVTKQVSPSMSVPPIDLGNFLRYLEETPAIRCNMHTPLATEITLLVYKSCLESGSLLPTTTTQLYTSYTRLCLHKYLDNHSHFSSKLWKSDDFRDLPAPLNWWFTSLCHLAFDGLLDGQRLVFPNVPSHLRLETLELMQAQDPLYDCEESAVVSYHYNHLTLQEFLSALLLSWMSDEERSEIVQRYVNDGHYTMVLRFLSGLTKSCPIPREHIMKMLDVSKGENQLTMFHWLYEARYTDILHGQREIIVRSHYSWSSLDYYVCAFNMKHSNCIWHIDFRYSGMNEEKMTQFLQTLSSVSVSSGDVSSQSLPESPAPSLRSFDASNNELDHIAVDHIAKAVPHMNQLERLNLSNNPYIQRRGAVPLLSALCSRKTLKELHLWHTNIGEEDCEQLAQLLSSSLCLECLNVGENSLSSDSIHILFKGLRQNCSLRQLDIAHNIIDLEAMKILSSYLQDKEKCMLECLDVRRCHISPDTVVELAHGMIQNCSLKELDLSDNAISDKGTAAVGQAMTENKVITELNLSDCSITTVGGAALASSLMANSTLEELDIWGNSFGGDAIQNFARLLENNKTLKILNVTDNNALTQSDVDTLLNSLANNRVLKVLRLPRKFKVPTDKRVRWG